MGLLHQEEGMEKSTNKCGGRVPEDVHRCPNLNCKNETVMLQRMAGNRAFII